ncbi:MAG TPA: beta-glucosidase [Prolixibacteraceae bacterium]|nr:beta-glucosidase [Prolixibacteraceae bacterium]
MKAVQRSRISLILTAMVAIFLWNSGCTQTKWSESEIGDIRIVTNKGGQTLGYSVTSGIQLIIDHGFAFKDLNRNGELDPYEDWRLPVDLRTRDLAGKMTIEQIAGLMLYSGHQAIPAVGGGRFGGTYSGKSLEESGLSPWSLTDQQRKFLVEDNLRHVLITRVQNPEVAARWNNEMQALVEGIGMGIPANNSSDPRHGSDSGAEYNYGAGGQISMWPGSLGLAATFDPGLVEKFGNISSHEYRSLGIATALSPQIDLATEPRWNRFSGTFGENPQLAADMARAYVDGFQNSPDSVVVFGGWGYQSVNAMVKHWPGGGPEEGGRDGHFGYGAYAVYPGNSFSKHLIPFTEGAFKLNGPTRMASAVMPYYTISFNQDTVNGDNSANAYNRYIIHDLLRKRYGYDGVICTDWMVTGDVTGVDIFQGKPWGVEKLSLAERHYRVLMAGCDQFGGNNDAGPVMEAYRLGIEEHGETWMRSRFEESAVRLLRNIFRVGLFENPYLNIEETKRVVGNPDYMQAGYEAQLKSVVMLKNKENVLPLKKGLKVYIPQRYIAPGRDWFGTVTPERWELPVSEKVAGSFFELTGNPGEADVALVFIQSPQGMTGYDTEDRNKGGNGYVPISLQYSKYSADDARDPSIAGGSPFEDFVNRSYKGKTVEASNISDMKLVEEAAKIMKGKPVITLISTSNPTVLKEIEPLSDVILVHFQVQDQALMDILTGVAEPSALLPMQMPVNMAVVESQFEDVPQDMEVYTDSEGNHYDFGFGLNWSGVITDERVSRYRK